MYLFYFFILKRKDNEKANHDIEIKNIMQRLIREMN
jgi:hypothetical protein